MAKMVVVTGGVVSSLGKGIAAASLGLLLKSRGLRVTLQVLHDADVEIGRDLLVFGDDLSVRQVDETVADHLAKMFVAGSDQ